MLASSASGPRTTPPRLVVMVEGTPLQQVNRYAGGSFSSSEEEDVSPPLLDLPAVLDQFAATASTSVMAAASAPDTVETVMAAITESERCRNSAFDSIMAALGGHHSGLVQMLSDVRGDITRLSLESNALVELNRSTRLAVADVNKSTLAVSETMANFLQSVATLRPCTIKLWRRLRPGTVKLWRHTGHPLSRASRILPRFIPKPWMICSRKSKLVST